MTLFIIIIALYSVIIHYVMLLQICNIQYFKNKYAET